VYKIGWPPDEKNQDEWPGKKSPLVGPYLFAAEPRDPVPRNICLIGQRNRGQRRTLVLCRTGLRRTCCLRSWSVFRPSRLGACERGGRKAISIHRLYPGRQERRGKSERTEQCGVEDHESKQCAVLDGHVCVGCRAAFRLCRSCRLDYSLGRARTFIPTTAGVVPPRCDSCLSFGVCTLRQSAIHCYLRTNGEFYGTSCGKDRRLAGPGACNDQERPRIGISRARRVNLNRGLRPQTCQASSR
jgi:hypothetical protein